MLIIAIVGTTVAPWQLFFQQSNVIDKRITPRFLPYERADTVLGSFVVIIGAGVITTVFTRLHAGTVAIWLAIALAAGVLVTGAWLGGG